MDGMVKVRSEYLREEAALLSEECEQAFAEYYEQAERGNVDAAGMDRGSV